MHHLPTFLTVHFVYTNNIIQCQESMNDIHCQEHNKSQPLQTDHNIVFLSIVYDQPCKALSSIWWIA